MCGIAGIYNARESSEHLLHLAARMRDRLRHRGPDDDGMGVWDLPGNTRTALAHTRLSIQDLSPQGHQPMESSRTVLVFNGEIYNFHVLRQELKQRGCVFHSQSDTEVLLQSYETWGTDCFARFNGMWALALLDKQTGRLILSRDRLGIKPLYYVHWGECLAFASEVKALLELPGFERTLNPRAVSDYLSYRYVLDEESFFASVHALAPAHHLVLHGSQTRTQGYWQLPVIACKTDPGEAACLDQTRALFEQAVAYRMISDVPFGAYLSGGLDSSAIVAQMARLSTQPVKTFTIGFDVPGFNEFAEAREMADRFRTDHHEITLTAQDYADLLPKVIATKDAPLSVPNEVALFLLSEHLKQHISVVLSGEGADELFGGYGRIFRSAFDFLRMEAWAQAGPGSLEGDTDQLQRSLQAKYGAHTADDPLRHFLHQYTYMPVADKLALLQAGFCSDEEAALLHRDCFARVFQGLDGLDLHDKYMYLFQVLHLPGLLYRLDSTTMAWAVEARVPFVDHELIEYVSSLPLTYRLRWRSAKDRQQAASLNSDQISETHDITKFLLRRLCKEDLPERIVTRKKMGFPVPLDRWLGHDFNDLAQDLLLAPDARSRPFLQRATIEHWLAESRTNEAGARGMGLWMLLNLEMWMRTFRVSC